MISTLTLSDRRVHFSTGPSPSFSLHTSVILTLKQGLLEIGFTNYTTTAVEVEH